MSVLPLTVFYVDRAKHLRGGVGLLCAAAIIVAGCQSQGEVEAFDQSEGAAQHTAGGESSSYERNQELWTLPTDIYFGPESNDMEVAAMQVLRIECMRNLGYDYNEKISLNLTNSDTESKGLSRIFNSKIAQKYGYRTALDPRTSQTDNLDREKMGEKFVDDYHSCTDKADVEVQIPEIRQRIEQSAQNLPEFPGENATEADWQVYAQKLEALNANNPRSQLNRLRVDYQTPELQDEAHKWHECMLPLGIPDLPDYPWRISHADMPKSLMAKWNWEPSGTPSADEIEIATHDAQCRETSGWLEALYEEEWRIREEFLAKNSTELEPILEEARKQTEKAKEILAAHGYL